MPLSLNQRIRRLVERLSELTWWRERASIAVEDWTFDGEPIAMGAAWPRRDGTVVFAAEAEVPEDWPLEETRLILDLGGESLVTLDGGDGKPVRFGLDPYHGEFPLRTHRVSIRAESVARKPFGQRARTFVLAAGFVDVCGTDGVRHNADLGEQVPTPGAGAGKDEPRGPGGRHDAYLKR